MALTRTLAVMRTAVAQQAGIDTDAVGGTIPRHPTAWVNGVINDAYRSHQAFMVANRFNLYKLATTAAALPTSPPVTGELYAEVAWPSAAADILGIDVLVDSTSGLWRPLESVQWEERRSFDPAPLARSGALAPYAFSVVSQGSVSATTFTTGTIALFPLPRSGSYKIWYLPEWTSITTDTHLFLFASEDCVQWTIWEAVRRIATRDNDANARLAEAARQLNPLGPDTVARRIVQTAPRHVRAGTQTLTRAWNY